MTPASAHHRTVVSSGLLCCALILVVLFTSPAAFRSAGAVVVMALIGAAAVLVQLRFRSDRSGTLRPPLWLNVIGIVLALAALFPAIFHLRTSFAQVLALGAVGSFAASSAMILHSFRKQVPKPE